jgi:hypothetical protein
MALLVLHRTEDQMNASHSNRRASKRKKTPREKSQLDVLKKLHRKQLTELRRTDAEIARREKQQIAASRLRAMDVAAKRSGIYRDGTSKDTAAHREIARRYAWEVHGSEKKSVRPKPHQLGTSRQIARFRMRDLEQLFSFRHGRVLPDNEHGNKAAMIAANHIPRLAGDGHHHIMQWLGVWAPWMPLESARSLAGDATACPRNFRAPTLGMLLQLSAAERQILGITTIAAYDQSAEEARQWRLERRRLAEEARRRRSGIRAAKRIRKREPNENDAMEVARHQPANLVSTRETQAARVISPTSKLRHD